MNKKKKKDKLPFIFTIFLFLLMGFSLNYFIRIIGFDEIGDYRTSVVLLAVLVAFTVSFYLQIIIHEGGHLIFGLLSGYKFVSFRVMSIMLIKIDGKLKIKQYSLAGTGGQCLMDPPELIDGQMPFKMYNAGGYLLNVFTAIIAIFLAITFEFNIILRYLLMFFAFTGIVLGVSNAIPMKIGGIQNDGANIIECSKNKEILRCLWIQLKIMTLQSKGVRLKDMPDEYFEVSDELSKNNALCSTIKVFKCNRFMDMHEFEKAMSLGEILITNEFFVLDLYKAILKMDLTCCFLKEGIVDHRIDKWQDKYLKSIVKAMSKNLSVLRYQYALALLNEKDEVEANLILGKFEKAIKNYPYTGDIASERELIDTLKNKIDRL